MPLRDSPPSSDEALPGVVGDSAGLREVARLTRAGRPYPGECTDRW